MNDLVLTVSDFIALTNQTLEYAYPKVVVEGEVSGFSVNQGKFVFFDLKDEASSVGCFLMVFQLKVPIEDGMKVKVVASPKLTSRGRFSLTVKDVRPLGEGGLKRSFELLKAKLETEGLFDVSRKRILPSYPKKVAIITSESAAGYADFIKIAQKRWAGVDYHLLHVQVQGAASPDQIVAAIDRLNKSGTNYDALVLIRGGGSLEDLQSFNTEPVVRAISGSRYPTIVGVGHETDVTLAGLAADVRAATPSEAAEILLPNLSEQVHLLAQYKLQLASISISKERFNRLKSGLEQAIEQLSSSLELNKNIINSHKQNLILTNPKNILKRGFSIARYQGRALKQASKVKTGDLVMLQLHEGELITEVREGKK